MNPSWFQNEPDSGSNEPVLGSKWARFGFKWTRFGFKWTCLSSFGPDLGSNNPKLFIIFIFLKKFFLFFFYFLIFLIFFYKYFFSMWVMWPRFGVTDSISQECEFPNITWLRHLAEFKPRFGGVSISANFARMRNRSYVTSAHGRSFFLFYYFAIGVTMFFCMMLF